MAFKFEELNIWQQCLDDVETAYKIAELSPVQERYDLSDQLRRAATSVSLNIAEGSTGQTDKEHSRFLSISFRSLTETVACIHIIKKNYCDTSEGRKSLDLLYKVINHLAARILAMRNTLAKSTGEEKVDYFINANEVSWNILLFAQSSVVCHRSS